MRNHCGPTNPIAAGLTLRAGELARFRRCFDEYAASRLTPDDMRPIYEIDAELSFSSLSERCVKQILSLGPFGFGNAAPIFCCSGVEVAGPPKVLNDGKHLNLPLKKDGRLLFAKAWNFGDRAELFERGAKLDVLLQIEDDPLSRKRGYGSWCLSVKDARSGYPSC